jgi:hypothetical protein
MKDLINLLTNSLLKDKDITSLALTNEIKVNQPGKVTLDQLESLQSRIEASTNPEEQASLAIQCAEKVLFIFEEKYPEDKRPRKAIEAAKKYLADPTEENKVASKTASKAANAAAYAANAASYAASYAADAAADSTAYYAAAYAISAFKLYNNINEIKVNQPGKVTLSQLENLKSRIKASQDPKEKISLAIQCAEKVLFIFEEKYPEDKRPRQAIEAAKKYLANPTEENEVAAADASKDAFDTDVGPWDAFYALYTAAVIFSPNNTYAATTYAAAAYNAAETAIKAFKSYNNIPIDEIKVNQPEPSKKLKAFQNPSGAIYLIFKGTPKNSTLKKYVKEIGWLNKKTNQVEFESAKHTIDEFKNVLNRLNISFNILSEDGLVIGIDFKYFNIKPIDNWTIYDEDVEKENWFTNISINEIKILQPGKVTLDQLENLQSRIKASDNPEEKISLAIQCAEKVLFIFEEKYPNDKRPRKAIEAAKKYLEDPTEENKAAASDAAKAIYPAAFDATDDASAVYAAYTAANAASTIYYAAAHASYTAGAAIKAFKIYNSIPLEEIKILQPGNKGNIPSKYYTPEISDLIKSTLHIIKHYNYDYISFVYGLDWMSSYRKKDNNELSQGSLIDRDLRQFLYEIGYHLHKLDPSINRFILDKYGKVWIGDKYNQVIYNKIPLNEIKVNQPRNVSLDQLENLQSKIEASQDPKERLSLMIQCAEKVLFIFEEKYPNDKHPRQAIEAAKKYLADPTEENRDASMDASEATSYAASALYTDAAAFAAYAASDAAFAVYATQDAADKAIKAFKLYKNIPLEEIKVNQPQPPPEKSFSKEEIQNLFKQIREIFGNRLKDYNEFSIYKKPNMSMDEYYRIYGGRPKVITYGTLYDDAISFGMFIENVNEEDKKILQKLINDFTKGHAFKGVKNINIFPNKSWENQFSSNVGVGIYLKNISSSGGVLEEIRINQPQNHNKIWQDCFDNAKIDARYQQEIYGEYIDIEEVYQAANECFKEKTGLDIDTLELDEIKINQPRKHWNLTKHISNFNPTNIQVRDKITIKPKRKHTSSSNTETFSFTVDSIERADENGFLDPNGEFYYFNFKKENSSETHSYSSNQLIWFNQNNLNEIKILQPGKVTLDQLESLKSRIEATNNPEERASSAIQCAEKVLFIFEEKYPEDKRPRKAIEAAKKYLEDPTEENRKIALNASQMARAASLVPPATALYASYAADAAACAATSNFAYFAAYSAIKAFKLYKNIPTNEIKVNQPGKVTLDQLKSLESRIRASQDPEELLSLSIQSAEKVLFIFEKEYPNDKRPRQAIEAAKKYLEDPTEENKAAASDAAGTAYDAYYDASVAPTYTASYAAHAAHAASATAYYAADGANFDDAIDDAISAFKLYNNINEIKVNQPNEYEASIYLYEESYLTNDPKLIKGSLSFIEKKVIDLLLSYDRYRKSDEYWAIVKDNKTQKELFRVEKINDEYVKYDLNEIKVNQPNNKEYKFNPEFQEWIDSDWDDIRYEFDEDTADAIWMFNMISPDNKTLGKNNINIFLNKHKDMWEGDADSLIEFLLNYRVIIPLDSQITENKINKPTNLKDAIKSLTEYMIDQGMNIEPLPKLIMIDDDSENANDILGKTAYYNPSDCSITLYTLNRHPKDVMRSYTHEMIHRIQDNENRLNNISTTNTNEGGELLDLEREAYEKGNITFRNWEDLIKNQ